MSGVGAGAAKAWPSSGRLGPFGDRTFAILFAAAYGALLLAALGCCPFAVTPWAAPAGAAYVLIGTAGFAAVERSGRLSLAVGYFALQLLLGGALNRATNGDIGAILLVLLLGGQAVRVLPARWMIALLAMLVTAVLVLAPNWPLVGSQWPPLVQAGYGFLVAAVFMVAFAQVAIGEQRQRAALDRANAQLRSYAAQVEHLATSQERNRLAREIHDGLGHYLTVINMQVEGARAVLPHDRTRAEQLLARTQTLVREMLADVRHSVVALRAGPSDGRPLPAALAALVAEASEAGVSAALDVRAAPRPLPPQAELALYRAAQEGLTNVRKHARAAQARVTLDYGALGVVRLAVADDGVGAVATDGGFGLVGLRERVGLLGGAVAVHSTPGTGLTLTVEVPG